MQARSHDDRWSAGAQYEPYVGRWSRIVAGEFVRWLAQPAGLGWLDVGCGTGALTSRILALAQPVRVDAVDPSAAFLGYAEKHIADSRATFRVGDARALPVADASVDAAVSGLVLNFVPQPEQAVQEMVRATRAGGVVAAYVWDYADGMQMIRRFWQAAAELDPAAAALDEAKRFPLCRPEPMQQLFSTAGLRAVTLQAIDIETHFESFDAYWSPFLGGQGPAPGYAMSLDDEHRSALRERLRATLPVSGDGSMQLTARAWAVRGARMAAASRTS